MLRKIKLQNFKKHQNLVVDFESGVNIISGKMGVGKSSLFQALLFCLFNTFPELNSKDIKLKQIVRHNHSIASVSLTFDLDNKTYEVIRKIEDGSSKESILRENQKLLAGPQPTQVNTKIAELFKITSEDFFKTLYVTQGELDLIIKLSPLERKKRIDQILKLEDLETIRENSIKLTNLIKTQTSANKNILERFDIKTLDQKQEQATKKLLELKEKLKKLDESIKNLQENKKTISQNYQDLKNLKETLSLLLQRKKDLEAELQNLSLKLKDIDLEQLQNKISQEEQTHEKLKKTKEKKQFLLIEQKKNQEELNMLRQELSKHESSLVLIQSKDQEKQDLNKRIQEINQKFGQITKQDLEELETALNKLIKQQAELEAQSQEINKSIEGLLASKAICFICSSPLSEHTKQKLLGEKNQIMKRNSQKLSELKTKLPNLELEKSQKTQVLNKIILFEEKISSIGELKDKIELLKLQKIELTKKQEQKVLQIKESEQNIESVDEEIQSLNKILLEISNAKTILQIQNTKKEKEMLLQNTQNELSKIDFDQDKFQEAENQYMQINKQEATLELENKTTRLLVQDKEKELKEITDQQKKFQDLEDQIKDLEKAQNFLSRFTSAVLLTQEKVREELLSTINEIMSIIWQEIYPHDNWSAIKLMATKDDYTLTLFDGEEWRSANAFASGGEKVLASLTLRLSLAKVLSPLCNFIILDEPTHNLDKHAIDSFIFVLKERLSNFFEQIFIITHDERLKEAGYSIDLDAIYENGKK